MERTPYRHLYFLYVWDEPGENGAPAQTRYRLEDTVTHEQHLFIELQSLVAFLQSSQASEARGTPSKANSE